MALSPIFQIMNKALTGPSPESSVPPVATAIPEVVALDSVAQSPGQHPEGNAWKHTLLALSLMPPDPDPVLAWTVLLHDVGKASTATVVDGVIRFPKHHEVGAEMAAAILDRLGAEPEFRDRVARLVRRHMLLTGVDGWKDKTFRRFAADPDAAILLEFARIDIMASHKDLSSWTAFKERLDAVCPGALKET